jgi:hypothetical protein
MFVTHDGAFVIHRHRFHREPLLHICHAVRTVVSGGVLHVCHAVVGDPKGWSTELITALGKWEKPVRHRYLDNKALVVYYTRIVLLINESLAGTL